MPFLGDRRICRKLGEGWSFKRWILWQKTRKHDESGNVRQVSPDCRPFAESLSSGPAGVHAESSGWTTSPAVKPCNWRRRRSSPRTTREKGPTVVFVNKEKPVVSTTVVIGWKTYQVLKGHSVPRFWGGGAAFLHSHSTTLATQDLISFGHRHLHHLSAPSSPAGCQPSPRDIQELQERKRLLQHSARKKSQTCFREKSDT